MSKVKITKNISYGEYAVQALIDYQAEEATAS